MAADSVLNLFRTHKLVPTQDDFDNPAFSPCDFLNENPDMAMAYIYHYLEKNSNLQEQLNFLTLCRRCYQVALHDLQRFQVDPTYPLWCCGEYFQTNTSQGIEVAVSLVNRLDNAIELVVDQMHRCQEEGQKPDCLKLSAHQWTYLIYIVLKVFNIDVLNPSSTNRVFVARLLHLLTCEDCPDIIYNSKYLDYLKRLEERPANLARRDLEAIRPYFVKVGLKEAIEKVDDLILEYT